MDKGTISAKTQGAKHGGLGHNQFLRGNALKYDVDTYVDGKVDFYNLTDSLASTANFLKGRGGNAAKVIYLANATTRLSKHRTLQAPLPHQNFNLR